MKSFKELNEILKTNLFNKAIKSHQVVDIGEKLHDSVKLTEKEYDHVNHYSDEGFKDINRELRYDSPHESTKHIDSAIAKHRTKDDAHVYRTVDKHKMNLITNAKKGNIITDKGYVSTTIDGSKGSGLVGGALYHPSDTDVIKIKVPKGSKALYLNQQYASEHPGEHEVLLPRNSKFKYIRRDKRYGLTIHHLEHIPEES